MEVEVPTGAEGVVEAAQPGEAVAGPEETVAGEAQMNVPSEIGEATIPEAPTIEENREMVELGGAPGAGHAAEAAAEEHVDETKRGESSHAEGAGELGMSSAGDASMAEAAQEDSEATSPSYHPQTQSGFVLSLSSEPSASALVTLPAGTRATFSTAFSSTEALVASSSAAPQIDVRAKFVEPIRLLFGEMTIGGWDALSTIKRKMATHCLRSFRSLVLDSLSEVRTVTDFGEVLETVAGEESQMQRMGFRLVGFQDVLQRLCEFHASWAEVEAQAQPQPPFTEINATEEELQHTRCHLIDYNHSRSAAQAVLAEANDQVGRVLSEREAVDAQISDLEAKLASLRETRNSLDGQLADVEARKAAAQRTIEKDTLEASMCESQIAAYNSRLAFLRSSLVQPDPALLQLFVDHRAAVDTLQGAFCDLFENIIP